MEVDFIVYEPKGLWAIEVKNTKRVDSKDYKPLEAFYKGYPKAKLLLFHRSEDTYKINHVICMSCENFCCS